MFFLSPATSEEPMVQPKPITCPGNTGIRLTKQADHYATENQRSVYRVPYLRRTGHPCNGSGWQTDNARFTIYNSRRAQSPEYCARAANCRTFLIVSKDRLR